MDESPKPWREGWDRSLLTQEWMRAATTGPRMLLGGQGGAFGGSQSLSKPHGAASPSRAAFPSLFLAVPSRDRMITAAGTSKFIL